MLDIVCFKWKSTIDARFQFGPGTVNTLKAMLANHYGSHRVTCITDDPSGIDPDVRIIPLWNDFADVPSPHGGKNPSCYRRLKLFSPEAATMIGPRFVMIDLDCVITNDMRPVFDRPEEFVAWGDTNPQPGSHYNGSLILLTAGSRRQVWDTFDPKTSPQRSLSAGCFGSDQGHISYVLGKGEARWTKEDGVYSFRNHLQNTRTLPSNARIAIFHGKFKPWTEGLSARYPWICEHYRRDAPLAVSA